MNMPQVRSFPRYTAAMPSPFLAERIRKGSNLEMEWQWAAEQVTDVRERRYCLERALHINPRNHETCRALLNLTPKSAPAETSKSVEAKRIPLLGS